jgi:GABA(A) receptor-associated protein
MTEQTKENMEKQRKEEVSRILNKFPDRIPVILEKLSKTDPDIDKKKFLVPASDMTVGQFFYIVRKRLRLKPEETLYFFVNNMLLSQTELMSVVYKNYKEKDGYLMIKYGRENSFG